MIGHEDSAGYPTLMVHLDADGTNDAVLSVVGDMAIRFHSRVVGIATGQLSTYAYGNGYVSGEIIQQNVDNTYRKIDALETDFRTALGKRNVVVEWRSNVSYGPSADYLALQARCADVILTGCPGKGETDELSIATAGALVLQAGRPVLVVPASTTSMPLRKVVICWRDTREARRAVVDAMGILRHAQAVDVVEVTTDEDMAACRARLADVVAWLALYGVNAMPVATSDSGDEKTVLANLIYEREGDFVVAGAYGHNRLREWVLGGVTRDLLMHSDHCSLLSH